MDSDFEIKIKRLCSKVIKEKKWRPFEDISVGVLEKSPIHALAFIARHDRKISVQIADDLEEQWSIIRSQDTEVVDFDTMLETIIYFMIVHEYAHHRVCPSNKENFEAIVSGVYEAIKGKEIRKEAIQSICATIHNLFSDTILNTENAHRDNKKEIYKKGLCYTYHTNCRYLQKTSRRKFFKQKIDKSMVLFLSQNFLFCNVEDNDAASVRRHYPFLFLGYERHFLKLTTVFTGDKKRSKKLIEGDKDEMERCLENMLDYYQWKKMAYEYTQVMYPFLKGPYKQLENSFTRKPDSQSTPQQGSQPAPQSDHQKGKPDPSKEKFGSPEKKKKDKKQDAADQGNKKDPVQKLIEDLESIPPHIPFSAKMLMDFDTLDELYKQRAGKIVLSSDARSRSFPIHEHPVGSELVPLQEFEQKNIDWGSTRIRRTAQGKQIDIFKRNDSIPFDFSTSHQENRGLPDLAFIIDSSTSMAFHPFKNDGEGNYHYAVLTFYSILKDLEEKNLAQLLRYKVINFSFTTIASPWCDYSDITTVKKSLFDYQGSGTVLDPTSLKELRESRHDECLVFMLSDTCFNFQRNQEEVFNEVKSMIQDPSLGFHLFQLGFESPFSVLARAAGASVHIVKNGQEFLSGSMTITKNFYEIAT